MKKSAWFAGWLVAGMTLLFIWLASPITSLPLLPDSPANNLGLLNGETTIQTTGFNILPQNAGVTVAPGGSQIRVTAFSFHPVTLILNVQSGGGQLEIEVNGVKIGAVDRANLAGTYSFSFVPRPQDNARPEMHFSFNLANATSPVVLRGLDLEFKEQWQPWFSTKSGVAFVIMAVLLLFLAGPVLLGRNPGWWVWLALGGEAAGEVILVFWLDALLRVGAGGALNAAFFWGDLAGVFYLMLFLLGVGVVLVPVKDGASVYALARPALLRFRAAQPDLSAALALVGGNALLTGLLYVVPAIQNNGFDTLARYWDGPSYLAVAYSLYDPASPVYNIPGFSGYSSLYWYADFPLVPLTIRLFSPLFGYIGAMFALNFVLSCGFAFALYKFLRDFGYARYPLWLSFVALFLPLRWLIYHSVGASEPATLFFSILCLYRFKKGNYWWAGLWGVCGAMARPNGFFLGIGLGLWLVWQAFEQVRADSPSWFNWRLLIRFAERFNWQALLKAILPMVGAVLAVFALYGWRTGDFLAYLHIPEDVTHLYPLPFLSLDIGVGRGEGDFYYYGLEAAGLVLLWQRKRFDLFWIGAALALPAFFILHDDVLRYSLPAFPFVFLIPFAAILESRPARWLAVPAILAVLIYSWSQLGSNQLSQAGWQQLLKFIG